MCSLKERMHRLLGVAGSPVRTERMAGKVVLTEEERQKVLMEVERQQTEFGTEK